jgi:hypothetical protein
MELSKFANRVYEAISKKENRIAFGLSTCGSFVFSWHLSDIHVTYFWLKAIASISAVIFGAPMSAFMKDIYEEKVYPIIFKKKKK